MKSRFTTLDLIAILPELNSKLSGMRVTQVFDVDHKTYLFKLSLTGVETNSEPAKDMLLIESGIRIHSTNYEWPKNTTPSGFSMKLRKHLNNKRLEHIRQLGIDRIVDMQFGVNDAAYHVILELYDRGNILITDHNFIILNILRPRQAGSDEDVKLTVRQRYPVESAKRVDEYPSLQAQDITQILSKAKEGENMKKILNPKVYFGASLIEHSLIEVGFAENVKYKKDLIDVNKVEQALKIARNIIEEISTSHKGYIIEKVEKRVGESNEEVIAFMEFHPVLFNQHKNMKDTRMRHEEMPSFDKAVDVFFSSIEGQKIDSKALQAEKVAMNKLDNVKKDHYKRLEELAKAQEKDRKKAQMIESNSENVGKALLVIRSAIANQLSWKDIQEMIDEAKAQGDQIATLITSLKLDKNSFSMKLTNLYEAEDDQQPEIVDIDIDLSAHANARKYYDMKRTAAKKEHKTLESSAKAFKNAERKTMKALKEVAVKTSIIKARKVYWFEKFMWFISSENYLVIGGRDAIQNEMIVKRYMKPNDVYVHADLHGATSVVIKNNSPSQPIPPKTLTEAADMSICYSAAWEAKVITAAWWVYPHQVTKTAPTGEYLTVGSFMVRGKKNYLPISQLVMGFGFMFKLDEESVERHLNERRKRTFSDEGESEKNKVINDKEVAEQENEVEIDISDEEDDGVASKFPDTKTSVVNIESKMEKIEEDIDDEGESNVIVRSQEPKKKQHIVTAKSLNARSKYRQNENKPKVVEDKNANDKSKQPKRGKKGKLKKLKEKYKDQDDEEREMRMRILGVNTNKAKKDETISSAHEEVNEEEEGKSKQMEEIVEHLGKTELGKEKSVRHVKSKEENNLNEDETEHVEEGDVDDDEETTQIQSDDIKVLSSLTGQPMADDLLLFAIPVCAPYSSMQSYKYKVKVLPGMNRRGKAAKIALQLFIRDKNATEREKDLLKSVKDQDIAKNLPNKIKITASNISSVKGKK